MSTESWSSSFSLPESRYTLKTTAIRMFTVLEKNAPAPAMKLFKVPSARESSHLMPFFSMFCMSNWLRKSGESHCPT